jgi:hypothetical protein
MFGTHQILTIVHGAVWKLEWPSYSTRLLPNSKPFYGKPFQIPQAYQKITREELADWNPLDC